MTDFFDLLLTSGQGRDYYATRQAALARKKARHAAKRAARANYTADENEERLELMAIACQAMWELLRDHTSLTDEDLKNKIHEIDLRDGEEDGKMSSGADDCMCPNCSAVLIEPSAFCPNCGHDLRDVQHIFNV